MRFKLNGRGARFDLDADEVRALYGSLRGLLGTPPNCPEPVLAVFFQLLKDGARIVDNVAALPPKAKKRALGKRVTR